MQRFIFLPFFLLMACLTRCNSVFTWWQLGSCPEEYWRFGDPIGRNECVERTLCYLECLIVVCVTTVELFSFSRTRDEKRDDEGKRHGGWRAARMPGC